MTSRKSSKKSSKTSRKTTRKTAKTSRSLITKNRQNKVNIQYYSNMSDVFKYSTQRKFMKSFLEENKKHNLLSKYPFVEMTACIFSDFKIENMKLVSAVSNDPTLFFKNTRKAVGKYYKDIKPVDLYITSVICSCAYKNDVLIGFIVTMLNDENMDGNVIRNILQTLLSGYIPNSAITYGGLDWKKIIYYLILVAQIIYFLLQCNHFYYSTNNLIHEINEGKTVTLMNTLKDISKKSEVLKKCIQYNEVYPKSNRGKVVDMVFSKLPNELYEKMSGFNAVYNCIEDPDIAIQVGEEAEFATYVNLDDEKEIIIDDIIVEEPVYPIMESNYGSTMPMEFVINNDNPLVAFEKDIPQITSLTTEQKEIMNNGLKNIFEKTQTKKTYKELLDYFNDLEEPENDKLARELMNDDDFLQYKMQEDERRKKFKEMSGIIIKDTSYIGMIGVITGAVKEVFWSSYSHAPLLDVITSIRNKINEYTRSIREKYNKYTDLIEDVTTELSSLSRKTELATSQLFNIVVTGSALGFQILGLSLYGVKRILDKRRDPLRSINDGENTRLIKNE